MLSKNKAIIVIILISLVVIVGAVVGFVSQSSNSQSSKDSGDTYSDPGSGERIGQDNAPQGTDASLENAIIYPGFSKLLDRGLTPTQIQSIQATIAEYSQQQEEAFKEVSLTTDSMRHLLPKDGSSTHTVTFDVVVDRTDNYYVTVEYADIENCVTKIYTGDKKTLLIER